MGKKLSSFSTRLFGHGNKHKYRNCLFYGRKVNGRMGVGEPPNQCIGNGGKLNKSMFIL